MRYKHRYFLAVLLVGIYSFAQAGDFELYGSKEAIELNYIRDIKLMERVGNSLSFGVFFDEDRDIIGNSKLMIPSLPKDKLPIPLSISVGAKAYLALINNPKDQDVFALAPGASARLDIPIDLGMPMYVDAEYFYAPEILTFGDANSVVDFTTRYHIDFLPRLTGFVGYRILRIDIEDTGRQDFDESFHIGLTYRYGVDATKKTVQGATE